MKKSFLAILFCMAFTAMFAQNSPADKANKATERMAKSLDLDQQQIEQVRAAYLEVFVGTSELNKSENSTRSAKQHEIQSKFDTDLAKVLTPEQSKKWNDKMKTKPSRTLNNKKHEVGQKKRGMSQSKVDPNDRIISSSNRTADRMAKQLELNESQRDQLFEAHKKKLTDMQTLRNNKTDRSEMINKKQNINKDYQAKIDNILTAEQIEKRQSMRSSRIQQNNNRLEKGPGKKMEIENRKSGIKDTDLKMEDEAALYTERMTKKLGLTSEQVGPFKQAFLNRITATKGVQRASSSKSEKGEVMTSYKAELEKILNAEQLQKLEKMNNYKKRSRKG